MKTSEIYEQIQQLNSLIYKINKREDQAVNELNRLHKIVFGENINTKCSNCHIKAFNKLINLTIQDLETMENSKYKIKKGVLIEYPSGTHYTSVKGIPDDVAKKYLKDFPQLAKNFEEIPKEEKKQEAKKEENKKD